MNRSGLVWSIFDIRVKGLSNMTARDPRIYGNFTILNNDGRPLNFGLPNFQKKPKKENMEAQKCGAT